MTKHYTKAEAKFTGHVVIRDRQTKEVLVDQHNDIHYGNMSWAVSQALAGNDDGHITYMIFGNGGTSVDGSGQILYKLPNTSNLQDPTALPYNPTYFKLLPVGQTDPENKVEVVPGDSNFSDLVITVTLAAGEPLGQNTDDTEEPIVEEYVFDEMALFTNVTDPLGLSPFTGDPETDVAQLQNELPGGARMLTHLIHHPVQKTLNRELEIVYTIRVQMGP